MWCCGFGSASEVYVYITCLLLGIALLMPLNALFSAPSYVIFYYRYVTGDENAKPNSAFFWGNILTFYNLVSLVTQAICGPTVLTPWARKLSLTIRFTFAISLMMLEVLVVLVMPAGHVSQIGAIVAFFIVTIAAGAGKSYLEATCYALVGTMPPKFMSAIMFGCGLSGVISSVLQCIIKASMDSNYWSVLKQAYIYFSLALGFMAVALGMALSLRWNTFAQDHVGEFRALRRARAGLTNDSDAAADLGEDAVDEPAQLEERRPYYDEKSAAQRRDDEVCGDLVTEDKHKEDKLKGKVAGVEGSEEDQMRPASSGEEDSSSKGDDRYLTTVEQMQRTKAWPIVKMIWPVMLASFITFFVSYLIMPSLIIPVDRTDKWYSTIAILLTNCGDAAGSFASSFSFLRPSRKILVICATCRFVLIPLTFLCIYHYIPGHIAAYVIFCVFGVTTGFFGTTSMVLGPNDKRLRTEGQRVMAGQLMGVSLLAGASVSSLLAILIVFFLPQ